MAGERGAADAERDVRGFALKIYTEEGNWDIVGNNTPVFFVRDPLKFSDFIHTQKRDPQTNLRNNTAAWDFWSLSPESLHQVTILMSDRGLPKSYRQMHGFGSHTYSFYNAAGERFWVKFHFKSLQGIENFSDQEAAQVVGGDRESAQRDLFGAIEKGDYPRWRFCVQVMPEAEANSHWYNPFDLTKVWPHGDYPLIDVGILELNRNPENYFAEVEQAAFAPANVVPGIGHSPDKMLQARIVSYTDAHRYRLGVNYQALPVNKPQCPVMGYHRDGRHAFRRQLRRRGQLRAEQLRRTPAVSGAARAAARDRGSGRPLRPPRRQRRLPAAGRPLPAADRREAPAALRQHRAPHGERAAGDPAARPLPFLPRRSGLRPRGGRRSRHRGP